MLDSVISLSSTNEEVAAIFLRIFPSRQTFFVGWMSTLGWKLQRVDWLGFVLPKLRLYRDPDDVMISECTYCNSR